MITVHKFTKGNLEAVQKQMHVVHVFNDFDADLEVVRHEIEELVTLTQEPFYEAVAESMQEIHKHLGAIKRYGSMHEYLKRREGKTQGVM